MLTYLISFTPEQKQLQAYSSLLDHILDGEAKDLIRRVGIEYVVKEIRGRYKVKPATIQPV